MSEPLLSCLSFAKLGLGSFGWLEAVLLPPMDAVCCHSCGEVPFLPFWDSLVLFVDD